MDDLVNTVAEFLKKNQQGSSPLLLALSGGPDSRALFEILLLLKNKALIEFHVAHINHNWRIESLEEAKALEALCHFHQIPFHLYTLNPKEIKGNWEDEARKRRLTFYKKLFLSHQFEAVILGHQQDDQVETVLKRVLEGASLPNLRGIQKVAIIDDVVLWRPLLNVSKDAIYNFLNQRGISYFEDSSNRDPHYLRSRMRHSLIPEINRSFGKEIGSSLIRLSKQAQELHEFLTPFWEDFGQFIKETPWCIWIDFTSILSQPFLLKYFLRNTLKKYLSNTSEFLIESVFQQLVSLKANKTHILKDMEKIDIDRGHLFIRNQNHMKSCKWELHESGSFSETSMGWKALLISGGLFSLSDPQEKSYQLVHFNKLTQTQKIRKWYTNHKVPHFLISEVPVLCRDGEVVHEFLTGKMFFDKKEESQNKKKYHLLCILN